MQLESQPDGAVGLGQRVHACSQTRMTGVAVRNVDGVDEVDGCGQRMLPGGRRRPRECGLSAVICQEIGCHLPRILTWGKSLELGKSCSHVVSR